MAEVTTPAELAKAWAEEDRGVPWNELPPRVRTMYLQRAVVIHAARRGRGAEGGR